MKKTQHEKLPETMTCHECGGVMRRDVRPDTIEYQGHTAHIDLPAWYCEDCEEAVLSSADMQVTDKALHEIKAKVEWLLLPAEVKAIRTRLKLSQRKAGEILGGGPRAFQKYEAGKAMVSRAMSNQLRLLAAAPALLKELMHKEVG